MRRFFWAAAAAAVVVGVAPSVGSAQFGGGPGVPAVPQPVVPGAAAPAGIGAAGPRVGFFQRMKTGMGDCIQKLLDSPFGQLLNNATKPLSALTGGVLPTLEKKPSVEDTKQPGVGGAAAQGKKDAAEAAKRRADVKYLGTLDCRYYPEASKALADALRTDPSECVRYEAALALTRGCCCNQVTIKALTAAVSGYEEDGNPGERSARVRCTAAIALEKCLACYVQTGTPDDLKPDDDCPKKDVKPQGELKKGGEKSSVQDDSGKATGMFASATRKQAERAKEVLTAFVDTYATTEAMYGTRTATGARNQPGILEASAQVKAPNLTVNPAAHAALPPAPAPKLTPPPSRMTEPQVTAKRPVEAPAPVVNRVKFKPEAETPPAPLQVVEPATPPLQVVEPVAAPPVTVPLTPVVSGPVVVPAAEPVATPVEIKSTETKPAEAVATVPPVAGDDAKEVEQLVHKVLLSETTADQHAAIRKLVKFDWTNHPLVASCLVAGAKSNATDAVRVDCIRHLAHYQMSHKDVLTALADLCADSDPWVRDEAAKAVESLKK